MALRAAAPGSAAIASSQIVGTTTNDNAVAGIVGEFISSTIAAGSAVSLTTATAANITSISLTAGDWDVAANLTYTGGATTNLTRLISSISTTTATIGTGGTTNRTDDGFPATFVPFVNGDISSVVGTHRISIAVTTTVYLVGFAAFSVSTCSGYGQIRARRVR
jgi:hypothetical protein